MNIRQKIYNIIELNDKNELTLSRIYDSIMLMAIILSIVPLMFRQQSELFLYFDIIPCSLFIIDYILRWITADYHISKKHGKLAFVIYPFTFMAIIDLLSILPSFNILKNLFKTVRIIRFIKIIRLVKIIRYFEPLQTIINVIKKQKVILMTVFGLALFYVFITALIMFNAEQQIDPTDGEYIFNNFFDAFYWASCTLTTVGYGDICPISAIGKAISIISSIVGIAIIALPSGIITAGYMEEIKSNKTVQNY